MCYKVIYNDKIVDALHSLVFLKYDSRLETMVLCDENEAQAVLSSDGNGAWHEKTMYNVPTGEYKTVELVPISDDEYVQLTVFKGKSPQEIIDDMILYLVENGIV